MATKFKKIPARSRRAPLAVAKRVWAEFFSDAIPTAAGAITFFVLLALFPAVGSLVSIYGLVSERADVAANLNSLVGFLPDGAILTLGKELKRLTAQPPVTLSAAFLMNTAIALWSASGGFRALVEGMNVAFEVTETRSFARLSANGLIFTIAGLIFAAASIATGVVVPALLKKIEWGIMLEGFLRAAVWPLSFCLCTAALAIVYRFGPNRVHPQWRWITWGSSIATVMWLAGTALFSWYVQNFGTYNQIYGDLGALIGFLVWLWISIMIVLLGAEINSELELAKHR